VSESLLIHQAERDGHRLPDCAKQITLSIIYLAGKNFNVRPTDVFKCEGNAPGYGIFLLRTMGRISFAEDAAHGERLTRPKMANTEIGVPGGGS